MTNCTQKTRLNNLQSLPISMGIRNYESVINCICNELIIISLITSINESSFDKDFS
jgi:hypothetical protein